MTASQAFRSLWMKAWKSSIDSLRATTPIFSSVATV
jgi:hypothetical protein